MAKIVLNGSFVNGNGLTPREIPSDEVIDKLVGRNWRPPLRNAWFTIYTDDGKEVHIGVPLDGRQDVSATVSDWDGTPPDADPPGRPLCLATLREVIGLIGQPDSSDPSKTFGPTNLWKCGCSAAPRFGGPHDLDEDFEWIQCDAHARLGARPHGTIELFGADS